LIQTLGEDHYGLRLGAFGTGNLVHDIQEMGAINANQWIGTAGKKLDVDAQDRPYDYWGTLKNVDLGDLQKGTIYTLLRGDLGAFDPGTYTTSYTTDKQQYHILGSAVVTTYTKDYVQDPDGEISYGYFLTPFRVGGKEVMMDPSAFHRDQYTVNKSGDVIFNGTDELDANGSLVLNLSASNKYVNSSSNITQKLEWAHDFTYNGTGSATAYLNVAGNADGTTYKHIENYSADCKIAVEGGVIDATHQNFAAHFYHSGIPKHLDKTNHWSQSLDAQFSFTVEPGVHYYAFVNIQGEGSNDSGDYNYGVNLDSLTHLSVTFVDHEF
jgi:hypothetical protein